MESIYLVGFMGTGKTTVGKLLARALKRGFIEMDALIEKQEKKKIVKIFADKGEPYFRKLEKELLKKLAEMPGQVISCGGGLICDKENLEIMKKTGKIFNLSASSTTIYERTKKYRHRPLLNVADPVKKIEELLNKRLPYYNQAHYTINTDDLSTKEVAEKILELIKSET
jgi:shikimate kinase